jgi:hypothetical protein
MMVTPHFLKRKTSWSHTGKKTDPSPGCSPPITADTTKTSGRELTRLSGAHFDPYQVSCTVYLTFDPIKLIDARKTGVQKEKKGALCAPPTPTERIWQEEQSHN